MQRACYEHSHVRLCGEDLPGLLGKAGCNQYLREQAGDLGRKISIYLATEGHDTPERRLWVRGQRLAVRVHQGVSDRGATGVGVLDDNGGRGSEIAQVGEEGAGGVEVVDVVEGDLSSLQFFHTTQ